MKLILRSIAYFWPDIRLIAVLVCMIGGSVVFNLLSAWPVAIIVDTVLAETPKPNPFQSLLLFPFGEERVPRIIGLALLAMLIKILQEGCWTARVLLNYRIKFNGTVRVRTELFDKLEMLSLAWHRTRNQGDTIYRLTFDSVGPWGILDTLIGSGAATVTLTGMVMVMLTRSIPLTLVAMTVTPLLVVINKYFISAIRTAALDAKQRDADYTVAVQRAVSSISLIQAFGQESAEAGRFGYTLTRSIAAAMRLAWRESLYPFGVQVVFALGSAIIFGYGGWLVYQDQFIRHAPRGLTVGDLMIFIAYLNQLWDPLGWVLGFPTKIQTSAASCDRIFIVLDQVPTITQKEDAKELSVCPRTLSLSHLCFAYPNGPLVLRDINLTVRPGEMVAFIGQSGAGKSTLLSLLPRMYDPTGGAILLDHCDIRDVRLSDVRRHMAVVTQDSPLFPDTVIANLRYGRPGANEADVRAAAEAAGASTFIESLPEGYYTEIIEGAQNLSGGQRQRLAIARALLSEAPIIILDEPTSALDPDHENVIVETLRCIRGTRSIILVTHKIDSVIACNQIFVLSAGTIVERGTHEELLSQQGRYLQMVELSRGSRTIARRDDFLSVANR